VNITKPRNASIEVIRAAFGALVSGVAGSGTSSILSLRSRGSQATFPPRRPKLPFQTHFQSASICVKSAGDDPSGVATPSTPTFVSVAFFVLKIPSPSAIPQLFTIPNQDETRACLPALPSPFASIRVHSRFWPSFPIPSPHTALPKPHPPKLVCLKLKRLLSKSVHQ
jgi:hypothetical protein